MLFQFPEHWIAQLGNRIRIRTSRIHEGPTIHQSFRTLLDGIELARGRGSAGQDRLPRLVHVQYFHPFTHFPEALIYQTNDASIVFSDEMIRHYSHR